MDGFELPPGDPDALLSSLRPLEPVIKDLSTQSGRVKSGFATALSEWQGARADDFRMASAGVQAQVLAAHDCLHDIHTAVSSYAKTLRSAIHQIKDLEKQAEARRKSATAHTGHGPASAAPDPGQMMAAQHAQTQIAHLQQEAEKLRRHVKTAGQHAARVVEQANNAAVPNSESLTPSEISRKVLSRMDVRSVRSVSAANAWSVLSSTEKIVPRNAVLPDGSVDASKLADDLTGKGGEGQEDGGLLEDVLQVKEDVENYFMRPREIPASVADTVQLLALAGVNYRRVNVKELLNAAKSPSALKAYIADHPNLVRLGEEDKLTERLETISKALTGGEIEKANGFLKGTGAWEKGTKAAGDWLAKTARDEGLGIALKGALLGPDGKLAAGGETMAKIGGKMIEVSPKISEAFSKVAPALGTFGKALGPLGVALQAGTTAKDLADKKYGAALLDGSQTVLMGASLLAPPPADLICGAAALGIMAWQHREAIGHFAEKVGDDVAHGAEKVGGGIVHGAEKLGHVFGL